jgi:hypothetical protein
LSELRRLLDKFLFFSASSVKKTTNITIKYSIK